MASFRKQIAAAFGVPSKLIVGNTSAEQMYSAALPCYRNTACPNCGRHRVMLGGACEKCSWDADGGDYCSITGKCPVSVDGKHHYVPGNAIMGAPFNECEYCHTDEVKP